MNFEVPAASHATRLLRRLIESDVEFVVIGGVAAVVHGSSVTTRDIDICIRFSKDNLYRLAKALADLHAMHRLTAQKLPLEITEKNWSMFKNIYVTTDWGILDCLGEVAGLGNFDQVYAQSEVSDTPFGRCRVLTLDAIIRAKETVARPHDLRAAEELKLIRGKAKG